MFKNQFKKRIFQKRVLFVGIPDMAIICLDGLLNKGVNIVGVVGPKKEHPTFNMFKEFVLSKELNFIEFEKLEDENFINEIKQLNADIAVVCSFNYKIPKVLLDSVKGGFINVHPSLLPEYRGSNPYSSVILNGEAESGVTLHFMDEGFDTGDIVSQVKFPLSKYETMGTLFNRTNILVLDMLLALLEHYETKEPIRIKQPEGNFKRGRALGENDLFIDFNKTAEEIERFIRGLNPFLLAKSNFRGNITRIMSADFSDENLSGEIGTIVKVEGEKFYIKTKKGLLAPESMQFGSFFAGTAKDFIRILNPKIGEKFQ